MRLQSVMGINNGACLQLQTTTKHAARARRSQASHRFWAAHTHTASTAGSRALAGPAVVVPSTGARRLVVAVLLTPLPRSTLATPAGPHLNFSPSAALHRSLDWPVDQQQQHSAERSISNQHPLLDPLHPASVAWQRVSLSASFPLFPAPLSDWSEKAGGHLRVGCSLSSLARTVPMLTTNLSAVSTGPNTPQYTRPHPSLIHLINTSRLTRPTLILTDTLLSSF